VDDEGILTGIVTDRDVFDTNVIEKHISSSDIGLEDDEDEWNWEGLKNVMKLYYETSKIDVPNIPVEDIMVNNPATTFKNTPVSEVARMMKDNDYGQMPIKDEKNRLMAMIYELDLLQALSEE
jgi:CBS domain-containing protein